MCDISAANGKDGEEERRPYCGSGDGGGGGEEVQHLAALQENHQQGAEQRHTGAGIFS